MSDAERILRLEACVDNLTKSCLNLADRLNQMEKALKNLEYRTRKLATKKKGG